MKLLLRIRPNRILQTFRENKIEGIKAHVLTRGNLLLYLFTIADGLNAKATTLNVLVRVFRFIVSLATLRELPSNLRD